MHTMAAYFTAGLRFVMGQIVSGLSTLGAVAWLGCGYIIYTHFDCVVIVYAVTVSSIDLSLEESRVMLEDVNILGHYFIIE